MGSCSPPPPPLQVSLPPSTRVLLDVQPPPLGTLTIDTGTALVWGNEDGLVLDTHHILVRGEFHIGSATCRFTKKARIRLHGENVAVGRKKGRTVRVEHAVR